MATVEVTTAGLRTLASQHGTAAAALASGGAPSAPGPAFLASSAAVAEGHTLLAAALDVFGARATATSAQLHTAASDYIGTDETSAQQLSVAVQSVQNV